MSSLATHRNEYMELQRFSNTVTDGFIVFHSVNVPHDYI